MEHWAPWLADWTYRIIVLLLVGGGVYLLRERLKTLQTTVEDQQRLLNTMKTVLESTDERSMLARLKAHKKFVEEEKGAAIKKVTAQFEVDKARLVEGREQFSEDRAVCATALVNFAIDTLPYVPRTRRREFIEALDLGRLQPVKEILREIAGNAPDLETGLGGFAGSALAILASKPKKEETK